MQAVIDFCGFQTKNDDLHRLFQRVELAMKKKRFLIIGEPGSGKKLLAQALLEKKSANKIYRYSHTNFDFDADCAVIVENLNLFSFKDQTRLLEQMNRYAKVTWILLADEDYKTLLSKGLIDQRLSVIIDEELELPPLRDRKEDLDFIAENILLTLSWISGRVCKLSPAAKIKLKNYDWPGNVAELEGVLEKAALKSLNGVIQEQDLTIQGPQNTKLCTLAEMERKFILQTLQMTQQNKTKAAQLLGISIRTLRNKLSQYREEGLNESNV